MTACSLWLTLTLMAAEEPAPPTKTADKLQALHRQEAARWRMFLGEDRKTEAKLNEKPMYVWTNPTRSGGQHGEVYVWMHAGRPVVVGSIFSHPEKGKRMVCHEFHSLAEGKLLPERGSEDQRWEPQAAVEMIRLPDAPAPQTSAARRAIQMRLCRAGSPRTASTIASSAGSCACCRSRCIATKSPRGTSWTGLCSPS